MREISPSFRPMTLLILLAILSIASPRLSAELPSKISTVGAVPPAGAIVLFDGSNLEAWESQMNRQWEKTDGPADWRITSEGWLEVVPGVGSLLSKQRFGDCRLHLEYRLPAGEMNGGVYLLARYEVCISASEEQGPNCGAFGNLSENITPRVRADLGPNEWQSLDIEFLAPRLNSDGGVVENARATVFLNGAKIHDNVELGARRGAARRLGDAAEGALMLQEHGSPYQFRNIWIKNVTVTKP